VSVNEGNLLFVPLDELTTPKTGQEVIANHWWMVDPARGAVFFKRGKHVRDASPQCNMNKAICELLKPKLYPDFEIQFIPVAYIPMRDYEN